MTLTSSRELMPKDRPGITDIRRRCLCQPRTVPLSIHQVVRVGVDPERQKILVAKGTIAPRAAYSKLLIAVDSCGACTINPARFTYKLAPALYDMEKRGP